MKKVLVIGMTSVAGGVESFLMNYYRRLNDRGVHFDFLCPSLNPIAYSDEINENSKIFYVIPKSKNPFSHRKQLEQFFFEHKGEYIAIWANLNSLINVDYLKVAKKLGVKTIIVHSHNSNNMGGLLQNILHNYHKANIANIATDYWACSKSAAEWFYPEGLLEKTVIVNNAISVGDYTYDITKRNEIRAKYGLEGKKVIGHIGRLHFQKNQKFILELFKELFVQDSSYRLLLIGTGPDRQMLEEKASELRIENRVLFLGQQNDIAGWLSSFDLFLFPSLFEGLSIVGLEAQANGIPIVCSESAIGDEGLISPNVKRLSLDAERSEWCSEVAAMIGNRRISSKEIQRDFRIHGFDIEQESEKIGKFFRTI